MGRKHVRIFLRDRLAGWLAGCSTAYHPDPFADYEALVQTIQPGDVLLIEGRTRVARIIQVLTRSIWSHAALYMGDVALKHPEASVRREAMKYGDEARHLLLEADIRTGVTMIPLAHYADHLTRICRPSGLDKKACNLLLTSTLSRLREGYDTGQLLDLLRYLLPLARLPARLARRLWMTGTGEGSRTICSTMIVEAFQAIHYPVLPEIPSACLDRELCYRISNARLFVPADFDRSPFFRIIKYQGLDHPRFRKVAFRPHLITWKNDDHEVSQAGSHVNVSSMTRPDSQNGPSRSGRHHDSDTPQVDESH